MAQCDRFGCTAFAIYKVLTVYDPAALGVLAQEVIACTCDEHVLFSADLVVEHLVVFRLVSSPDDVARGRSAWDRLPSIARQYADYVSVDGIVRKNRNGPTGIADDGREEG